MACQTILDSAEKGNPADKLILYGFLGSFNSSASLSPFVTKVESYLRMNDIPYEVVLLKADIKKSPKKMAPFIEQGDVLLADSTFILEYLENTYADTIKVKAHSDPVKRGIAVGVQRICEDHLLHGVLWYRNATDEGYAGTKKILAEFVPGALVWFFGGRFRKQNLRRSFSQGFARHSQKDVMKLLDRSIGALSGILGDSKYITGDTLCPEDAVLFATLDVYLLDFIEDSPLAALVKKYPNLLEYYNNLREDWYPKSKPSNFRAPKKE